MPDPLAKIKTIPAAFIADGSLAPEKLSAPAAVYLKSPNDHYWRLTISDAGAISTTDTGTDVPSGETEESA